MKEPIPPSMHHALGALSVLIATIATSDGVPEHIQEMAEVARTHYRQACDDAGISEETYVAMHPGKYRNLTEETE